MAKQHRLTDAQWRKLFAEQRDSVLSVEAFCRAQGIASSTFFARRQRLREADRPAFVEVTAEAEAAEATRPMEAPCHASLEVLLPGGVVVRVPCGFDTVTLRRIVEALS